MGGGEDARVVREWGSERGREVIRSVKVNANMKQASNSRAALRAHAHIVITLAHALAPYVPSPRLLLRPGRLGLCHFERCCACAAFGTIIITSTIHIALASLRTHRQRGCTRPAWTIDGWEVDEVEAARRQPQPSREHPL